jgi:hypothetical protein
MNQYDTSYTRYNWNIAESGVKHEITYNYYPLDVDM